MCFIKYTGFSEFMKAAVHVVVYFGDMLGLQVEASVHRGGARPVI